MYMYMWYVFMSHVFCKQIKTKTLSKNGSFEMTKSFDESHVTMTSVSLDQSANEAYKERGHMRRMSSKVKQSGLEPLTL